jgi:DegV family protein with EDD domain
MARIRIVTDSTADLPEEIVQELSITVVPSIVRFGADALREGVDITNAEFYHRITVDPEHPSTSQPSPGEFVEAYQGIAAEADEIISIHVSSNLSGTIESATLAAGNEAVVTPVHVVDSLSVSMALGSLVVLAAERARDGVGVEAIVSELNDWIPRGRICFLLDTLEYLKRGGRIGAAQAFLGSLLKVKPILHIMNGVVEPLDRSRSVKKATDRMVRYLHDEAGDGRLAYAGMLYSTDKELAMAIKDRIDAEFEVGRWYVTEVGAVIGAHTGPGAVGVAFPARSG